MQDDDKVNEQDNAPQNAPQGPTGPAGPTGPISRPPRDDISKYDYDMEYLQRELRDLKDMLIDLKTSHEEKSNFKMTASKMTSEQLAQNLTESNHEEDKKGNGLYF